MIKVLSLFSGIGAFESALRNTGIGHEVVNFSEIYQPAIDSYCKLYNTTEDQNLGDITQINTGNIDDFDLMSYGFPCFDSRALILTDNGYKQIKDITVNDIVLTHTNKYQKVINTMKKYCEKLYKLKIQGVHEIIVTKDHPFFTISKNDDEPKWTKTKDLEKGMYIGINVNSESRLPEWDGVSYTRGTWKNHKIINNLSTLFNKNNFWYIVGRFLGDGWTTNYKRKNRINSYNQRTIICCNNKNNEIEEITPKLDNLGLHYNISKERTVCKIHIVNKELTNYLYRFNNGAKNKIVHQDVIDLPIDLLKSFLLGYIEADGHIDKKGMIIVTSISEKLIYGISQCVNKVYKIQPSISKYIKPNKCIIENRIVNQNNTYALRFKIDSKRQYTFYKNNYIWTPYKKKEIIDFNDYVYNIEVDNDNSYTVYNLIVHNCQSYSIAGKRLGMDDPKNGNLFYESMKIVKKKQPKYLIAENVLGLKTIDNGDTFKIILKTLNKLGYKNYWKVLNSSFFGVPQNRNRVFIVSIRKDVKHNFHFPVMKKTTKQVKDIVDFTVKDRIINKDLIPYLNKKYYIKPNKTNKVFDGCQQGIFNSGWTLHRLYTIHGISPTLTTSNGSPYFYEIGGGLVGKERLRLQGFTDKDYNKIKNLVSESEIAYMAGNSITINILENIFKNLLDEVYINNRKDVLTNWM